MPPRLPSYAAAETLASALPRRSPVIDHDVADGRVVLERIDRHVLAIARLLEAAVRHLVDQHEMGIDPRTPVLEARGGLHRFADILGPDRRGEAVVGVVGPGDGV